MIGLDRTKRKRRRRREIQLTETECGAIHFIIFYFLAIFFFCLARAFFFWLPNENAAIIFLVFCSFFLLFAVMKSRGHCVEWREWLRSLLAFVGEMLIRLTTLASGYQPKGLFIYIYNAQCSFFIFPLIVPKTISSSTGFYCPSFSWSLVVAVLGRYRRVIFIYLNVLSFPVREREGE